MIHETQFMGYTIETNDIAPHFVRWRSCARDEQVMRGFESQEEALAFGRGVVYATSRERALERERKGLAVIEKPELVEVRS